MYKRIFLVLIIILLIATPISATNWQPANYSNSDLMEESGLAIEEFNNLTQSEWLELFNGKNKVNYAFSATNSNGEDITNEVNPNLSINVEGLADNQVVSFKEVESDDSKTSSNISDLNQYDNVIFVDANNGSDLNGDGTTELPFKTIQKGFSKLNNNSALMVNDGLYNLSQTLLHDLDFDIIGNGKNTILDWGTQDTGDNLFENNNSIYNVVIKSSGINRVLANHNTANVKFYNCVFDSDFGVEGTSTGNIEIYNSSFLKSPYRKIGNMSPENVTISNTGFISTVSNKDILKVYETSLENVNFDENYNITSSGWQNSGTGTNPDGTQAHIGVYGGEFAW